MDQITIWLLNWNRTFHRLKRENLLYLRKLKISVLNQALLNKMNRSPFSSHHHLKLNYFQEPKFPLIFLKNHRKKSQSPNHSWHCHHPPLLNLLMIMRLITIIIYIIKMPLCNQINHWSKTKLLSKYSALTLIQMNKISSVLVLSWITQWHKTKNPAHARSTFII